MELRAYQKEAIKATYDYLKSGKGVAPIIEVFTGGGKSIIMSKIASDLLCHGKKILSITHVRELIKQNFDEFKRLCPEAKATIFSAGLGHKNAHGDIVFAGIQSFSGKTHLCAPFDLILIDECDLVSAADKTRYKELINILRISNPHVKIIGLTATPYRLDSGSIYSRKGAIFDGISYKIGYKDLLDLGFLCPIITKQAKNAIDLSGVKIRAGDYDSAALAVAASKEELIKSSIKEIVELGADRKKWLIFSSGIAHSHLLQEELKKYGVHSECVNGKTDNKVRDKINSDFLKGDLRCLINVGTHTTGFNCPDIDLIAIVRATMSTRLMVQMIGRGVRIAEGKENLLLLDFGNNIQTHGFLDDLRIKDKSIKAKKNDDKKMVKECQKCGSLIKIHLIECPDCGAEQQRDVKHDQTAYAGAVLKSDHESIIYDMHIDYSTISLHRKEDKPPVIKVTYMCKYGMDIIYDWICLADDIDNKKEQQNDFALKKGVARVRTMGGSAVTLSEAQKEWSTWKVPKVINYKNNGKFKNIVSMEF